MRKQGICILCCVLLCFGLLPLRSHAAILEPERPCSLTLSYTQEGKAFSGLEIQIHRVAQVDVKGTYKLVSPYNTYPIHIYGITSQKEWREVASTLVSYITADQVSPYRTQKTDEAGTVVFSGLESGLYLVREVIAGSGSGTYLFQEFMVYLPTPTEQGFEYDVLAKPKCSKYTPPVEYRVVKLWKDSSHSDQRPGSVSVDILKDGVLQETVVLNPDNNWSWFWSALDGEGDWSVVERDVPDEYSVTITEQETVFVITNTRRSPDDPGGPDDPDVPIDPDDPDVPIDPDDPDVPVDPDDPDDPVDPDDPDVPIDPDDPDVPIDPDDPDVPVDPDDPDDPVDPDDPDVPIDPDDPDVPIDPDDPDVPVDPDDPDVPIDPDDPDDPVDPDVPDDPNDPQVPKTGDTAPIWLYITLMCISGIGLMILGVSGRRNRTYAKKQ